MLGRTGTHYLAFDLHWLNNVDARSHPLERRSRPDWLA
jgi:hypothetical protein